jgi:hypothetical protein
MPWQRWNWLFVEIDPLCKNHKRPILPLAGGGLPYAD